MYSSEAASFGYGERKEPKNKAFDTNPGPG